MATQNFSTLFPATGGGLPSVFATKSASYTVLTTDAGTQFTLTGSGTLTLPSASSIGSGKGIYVRKTDGTGQWTITPSSGLVDARNSIAMYSEGSYALVSDGVNWQSQGRPKGWINIGTTSVTTAVASVSFTTGFLDAELRDMQFEVNNLIASGSDTLLARLQRNGTYATLSYTGNYISYSGTTVSAASITSGFIQMLGTPTTVGDVGGFSTIEIGNFASPLGGQRAVYAGNGSQNSTSKASTQGNGFLNTSSYPVTGLQFVCSGGANITGTFIQKAFRP